MHTQAWQQAGGETGIRVIPICQARIHYCFGARSDIQNFFEQKTINVTMTMHSGSTTGMNTHTCTLIHASAHIRIRPHICLCSDARNHTCLCSDARNHTCICTYTCNSAKRSGLPTSQSFMSLRGLSKATGEVWRCPPACMCMHTYSDKPHSVISMYPHDPSHLLHTYVQACGTEKIDTMISLTSRELGTTLLKVIVCMDTHTHTRALARARTRTDTKLHAISCLPSRFQLV